MSTILEALRKAKQKLPQESVDAPKGILSDHTHDYLAHIPSTPGADHSRLLKYAIGLGCVILLVLVALITLVLFKHPTPGGDMPMVAQATASPIVTPSPSPTPVATATPMETVISLTADPAPPSKASERKSLEPKPREAKPSARKKAREIEQPEPAPTFSAVQNNDMEAPVPEETALPDASVAISSEEVPTPISTSSPPAQPDGFVSQRVKVDGLVSQGVKIDGIVWDSIDPMAMISGKTVRVGSKVNGMEILKINKDSIIFDSNGKQVTVRQ